MSPESQTVAAFLRGLNVGGHRVKMEDLRAIFLGMGFENPRTILASGNIVFDASTRDRTTLESHVEAALHAELGYEVATFVRTEEDVRTAASDPFPGLTLEEGDRVHVLFLKGPTTPEILAGIRPLTPEGDELVAGPTEVFWLRRGSLLDAELSDPAKFRKTGLGPVTMRTMNTVRRVAKVFVST